MNHQRGLTLVSLLLLLLLIVATVAIALPIYAGFISKARNIQAASELVGLKQEILMYQIRTGHLPVTLAELGRGHVVDPWGRPYYYIREPIELRRKDRSRALLNTDYDLYSAGEDGQSALPLTAAISRDDVIRARDGEYIGMASGY